MKKGLHIGLIIISVLLFAGLFFLSVMVKKDESDVTEKNDNLSMKETVIKVAKEIEKIDLEKVHEDKGKVNKENIEVKKESAHKEAEEKKEKKNESKLIEKNEKKAKEEKNDESMQETSEQEQEKVKDKKDTAPKKKEYTEEKYAGSFYVTSESLNYRSGAGTNHEVIGNLAVGEEVQVTKRTSNGWYGFEHNGKIVYSSANLLSEDEPIKKNPKKEKPKNDKPKEEKPVEDNSQPNKTVADQFTGIDGNNQLILVTTNGYNTSHAQIRTFERTADGTWEDVMTTSGHIGKNGFADNKIEGDGKSPTGKYSVGHGFGYQGNPGTKMSFKNSTNNDVWVDDVKSKFYNTWQTKDNNNKDWDSAEEMMHRLYTHGFTINYNTNQTPGKGSAIFFHVGNSHTVGCTAMPQSNLVSVMKWIDPNKNPVIIQTPESGLSTY